MQVGEPSLEQQVKHWNQDGEPILEHQVKHWMQVGEPSLEQQVKHWDQGRIFLVEFSFLSRTDGDPKL